MADHAMTRRSFLLLALAGASAVGLGACSSGAVPSGSSAAAQSGRSALGSWDELVAAAKREGKVVVSGNPNPQARTTLTSEFQQRFGIEIEYLGGNSSQLAARVASERNAGQYTMDVSLAGSDTAYGTFLPNGWLEKLKPALVLPDVVDGSHWKAGQPWFRDPEGDTVLQVFNSVGHTLTLNTDYVAPGDIPTADALLDAKWRGKICAFDPSVNGTGIATGAALYVSKGKDFATQLYRGQQVVLSRDHHQTAEWLAHGSYPIALALGRDDLEPYTQAGVKIAELDLPDVEATVGGATGLVNLWKNAPHPNAARVFANWIASQDGLTLYSKALGQVPARSDINPAWLPASSIPQPGVTYLDTYAYEFETKQRLQIRDFYASVLK